MIVSECMLSSKIKDNICHWRKCLLLYHPCQELDNFYDTRFTTTVMDDNRQIQDLDRVSLDSVHWTDVVVSWIYLI